MDLITRISTIIWICSSLLFALEGQSQIPSFYDATVDFGLSIDPNGEAIFGQGVSFFDFNQDGLDDITIPGAAEHNSLFFTSTGDSLVQSAISLGPYDETITSLLWADYDNDNDMDLSATRNGGTLLLFENEGNLLLSDVSSEVGILDTIMWSFGAAWADYNLNGYVDLYATNRYPFFDDANRNVLYENQGDGNFIDITETAMVADLQGIGYGTVFTDFDKDGYPDIYIANDKFLNHNTLYRNLGNGTFDDVSDPNNTGMFIDGMGIAAGDYDGDGFEDLYVTNTQQSSFDFGGNIFLQNEGDGTFSEVGEDLELRVFEWGWGCNFADFNNDGHLDLFVGNEASSNTETNNLFTNNGDGTFTEDTVSAIATIVGNTLGSAVGDVNNDGFLDILYVDFNPSDVKLWVNDGNQNNWVKFTLEGTTSNKQAIGTWLEIYTNGVAQYRYKRCGVSYCSQDGQAVHFGLGSSSVVDSVHVIWPTMQTETYYNLSTNTTHHLVESSLITGASEDQRISARVYPNPSIIATQIQWQSASNETIRISLINSLGQVQKSLNHYSTKGNNTLTLSLEGLPTGSYAIDLEGSEKLRWQSQLIIQ